VRRVENLTVFMCPKGPSGPVMGYLLDGVASFSNRIFVPLLIPVAARSKAWVWGRSLSGTSDSNPAGGMDVCLL
jgi:hypothetical protein